MIDATLVTALALSLIVVLIGERRGHRRLVLFAKPVASASFVLLGFMRFTGGGFGTWMMIALVLCLVGDVTLVWPRAFVAGLVAFLLGHGAYVAAFSTARPLEAWPVLPLVAVSVTSVLAIAWLWPHLAGMKAPVVAYVAVITLMVWGAAALALAEWAPVRLVAGALFFYVSDLAVARNRFVSAHFSNRLVGLPLYYLGQVLLASTIR